MKEIHLSQLDPIQSPKQFFETEAIVLMDIVDLGPSYPAAAWELKGKAFTHQGQLYLPVVLIGSPEHLYLNIKQGVPFTLNSGQKALYKWDNDLKGAIAKQLVFDFRPYYKQYKAKKIKVGRDDNFLIDRFLKNQPARPA